MGDQFPLRLGFPRVGPMPPPSDCMRVSVCVCARAHVCRLGGSFQGTPGLCLDPPISPASGLCRGFPLSMSHLLVVGLGPRWRGDLKCGGPGEGVGGVPENSELPSFASTGSPLPQQTLGPGLREESRGRSGT